MIRKSILIILSVLSLHAFSQSRARVTQPIEWFAVTSVTKLAPKFGLTVDGQFRFAQGFNNMQHMVRFSIDYHHNKQWMISPIGYSHIFNYQYGEQPVAVVNNEHRLYQQIQFKHSAGKFAFAQRFRAEERFIQFHSGNAVDGFEDEGYDENFQFRIRHRAFMTYAINREKLEPGTWHAVAFVEAFMSWGDNTYVTYTSKIDQLRLLGGIGYQFNKAGNIQVGPYYQYLVKPRGDKQENNVGFLLQINYNMDLSKPAQ
jgi:hypothetical protein